MAEIENAGTTSLADENTRLIESGLTPGLPVQYAGSKAATKTGLDYTKANPNRIMDKQTETNVLQNMQNLADKIQNPLRMFNESMKDAQAWTQYNKSPAFALREEAAGNDRRALYDIAQQQAALKAANMQANATRDRINAARGLTPNAAPGAIPGAAPGAGAQGSRLPSQVNEALNLADPYDVGAQQAILNDYAKQNINKSIEMQNRAESYDTSKPTWSPELGKNLYLNAFEARDYTSGKGLPERYKGLLPGAKVGTSENLPTMKAELATTGPNADAARAAQRESSNNPNIGYHDLAKGTAYGTYGITDAAYKDVQNAVPQFKGRPITSLNQDEQTQAFNTYRKLTTDRFGQLQVPPTKQNLDLGHFLGPDGAARFLRDGTISPEAAASNGGETKAKQIANAILIGQQVYASGAAPSATTAKTSMEQSGLVLPHPKPFGPEELKANEKAREDFNKKNLELRKAEELEGGKVMSAIQAKAKDRDQIRYAAEDIIKEATKNPKAFAYQQQGGPFAMAAAIPVAGDAISAIYAAGKEGHAKTRQRVNTAADLLGVENTKDLFGGIGARIGAQLMNVGRSSKGVGTDISAEDNLRRATFILLGVDKVDEQAAAWKAYKEAGGTNGFDFLQSPQNKAIETKYENILKQKFPNEYEKSKATPQNDDKFEYRIDPVTGKKQMRKKDNG